MPFMESFENEGIHERFDRIYFLAADRIARDVEYQRIMPMAYRRVFGHGEARAHESPHFQMIP